jgi:opacity protein-like surface antigen
MNFAFSSLPLQKVHRLAGITLICGLILAGSAEAQPNRLYLNSGVSFPMGPGDVVDWWRRGATFDVAYGRRVAERFEVTLGLGHSTLPISHSKLVATGVDLELSGGSFRVTSLVAGLRLELERGSWFRPYLHVGVGLHHVAVDDLDIRVLNPEEVCPGEASCIFSFAPADRQPETVFGLKLGAGVAYYVGERFWLFAEPNYHLLFTRGDRLGWVPIRLGLARAF